MSKDINIGNSENHPVEMTPIYNGRPIKVMVIDDDEFILDMVGEFLSESGYEVSTATSGEDALKHFDNEMADIVMVDFKMEGIDGITTIEQIAEKSPSTVSILMTGYPTLNSSIQALRLGASDYIMKPFKLDEVSLSLEKAVREWKLREELAQLRDRVSELEESISEKKDNIKINKKLGVVAGKHGYSPKYIDLPKSD